MLRYAIIIGIFCGCLGFTARAEEKEADEKVLLQLDRTLPGINFSGQELADVLDFLRDVAGANIFVDWRALEAAGIGKDAKVEFQLKDAKFRAALKGILEKVGRNKGKAELSVQDGVIVISTAPDPAHPHAAVKMGTIPTGADRVLPEINLGGQALSDAIDFLRDVSGLNIFVDWRALERAGIAKDAPVNARLRELKSSTALRFVLESVSNDTSVIECTWADKVLTITAKPIPPKDAPKKSEK
jgi:hypothetical protein